MANLSSEETNDSTKLMFIDFGLSGRDDEFTIDNLDKFLDPYKGNEYTDMMAVADDVQRYYLIVLAVIGVPSNMLTVATILSMHSLSPATFFVVLLAIFDACALFVKVLGNQIAYHKMVNHEWFCKFMDPLSIFFSTTANWVLVLICLERFISVCYPLRKAYLFTKRRSYISAAILVGTLFTIITGIVGGMRQYKKSKCTTIKRFEWFFENVWLYMNFALFLVIPFLLIATLTACIVYGLQQSRKHRMSLMRRSENDGAEMKVLKDGSPDRGGNPRVSDAAVSRKSRSASTPATPTALHNQKLEDTARVERTITLMLIAAAVIFLVLCLPISLFYMIKGLKQTQARSVERARWMLYQMIAYIFIDSSHAINFFLYFFTAKRFRVQLIRVLTGRASCCGRRLSRRGGRAGCNGTRTDNGPGSKTATSNSTTSTCLGSNGVRVE